MVWASILVGFTSVCGSALAVFLMREEWKLLAGVRERFRELPLEVRRRNVRTAVATWLGMAAAAGLVFGTYEWGARAWTARAGAAIAIGVFVIVMAIALTAMVVQSYREVRREPSASGSDQHLA